MEDCKNDHSLEKLTIMAALQSREVDKHSSITRNTKSIATFSPGKTVRMAIVRLEKPRDID
jgi:hypothetical protein